MVTIQQIQKGAMQFIESDFAPHYSDTNSKIFLGGTARLAVAALPNIVEYYRHVLEIGGLLRDNLLDIDAAYDAYIAPMGTEKLSFVLPVLGKIDLPKADFDKLLRYIKEA